MILSRLRDNFQQKSKVVLGKVHGAFTENYRREMDKESEGIPKGWKTSYINNLDLMRQFLKGECTLLSAKKLGFEFRKAAHKLTNESNLSPDEKNTLYIMATLLVFRHLFVEKPTNEANIPVKTYHH